MVGGPPALQAALENKRIDAFMLSPPEAQIAEAGGYGRAFIDLAADFPALRVLPFLVLVARRPFPSSVPLQQAVQALRDGATAVETDPAATAGLIAAKYFPRLSPDIVEQALMAMKDGVATPGALSQAGIDAMVRFAQESGNPVGTLPEGAWSTEFIK
jgi:ABC-type nitrate/sulfonate/bicarbonate transport system substrate-binding protein